MKTILAELLKGKEYRLNAHGRIVRNRDDYYNQSEQQSEVIRATNSGSPSKKGNLGHEEDPACESQNVEQAVTKPKIDKQCSQSDLMEIKSQADLDPARECSEQMNASNPFSAPSFFDEESLDDISTDICERIYENLHRVFMDTSNNEVSNSIRSVGSITKGRKKKRNKTSAICG